MSRLNKYSTCTKIHKYTQKGYFTDLTLIELSADELIKTGSLAKKCSEIIELS